MRVGLYAPNIEMVKRPNDTVVAEVTRSPLPYNDRRRFGNRLKRLYAYLGTIKPKQYEHSALITEITKDFNPCGAVCCAFGHAVVSGEFKGIHAKAFVPVGRVATEGKFDNWDIRFEVTDVEKLRSEASSFGGELDGGSWNNLSTAADAYFGPGAWESIFDVEAYRADGEESATLRQVRNRIALVAKNAYNVDVTKP